MDEFAKKVSASYEADLYLYIGTMFYPDDRKFLKLLQEHKNQKNALVIFETPGGSAEVAYRIGRAIQRIYQTKSASKDEPGQFFLYVHDTCKSAGTILSLAADKIIMSQLGELGPIDVQLRKDDEVGERTSGLTPHQALETLQIESGSHFQRFFRQLRFHSELGFSTKLSADIAAQMAVGLMSPVYSQMDPSRLGEIGRHVKVASEYGDRLKTDNVKPDTIANLVAAYPSHDFVIDRREAGTLFNNVEGPSDDLEKLADFAFRALKTKVISSGESAILSLNFEEKTDENDANRGEKQQAEAAGDSSKSDNKDSESDGGQIRPNPEETVPSEKPEP